MKDMQPCPVGRQYHDGTAKAFQFVRADYWKLPLEVMQEVRSDGN